MKKYTIQIIPSDGNVKEFVISFRLVILLLVLFVTIIAAAIYFVLDFGNIYVRSVNYNIMKKRVKQLENREKEIEYLNQEIKRFYDLSRRLNHALGLNIKPKKIVEEGSEVSRYINQEKNNSKDMEEEARELLQYVPSTTPCHGGWVSAGFSREHKAIDISIKEGSSVFSTMRGEVVFSGNTTYLGNTIKIKNDEGFMTVYAHNSKNMVKKGDMVNKGDLIALSGSSGRSEAPHLHYAIKMQGKWVDPANYMPIGR